MAAAAADKDVFPMYDGARVSTMVTSQERGFPLSHGTVVAPSGKFPAASANGAVTSRWV